MVKVESPTIRNIQIPLHCICSFINITFRRARAWSNLISWEKSKKEIENIVNEALLEAFVANEVFYFYFSILFMFLESKLMNL